MEPGLMNPKRTCTLFHTPREYRVGGQLCDTTVFSTYT